ncbi:hypothetical protein AB1N83_006517 [Pleurotus pulmonarius]
MHASQVCWQGEGPTTLPGSPWTGIAPNHFELLQLLFARAYKMMQTSTGGRAESTRAAVDFSSLFVSARGDLLIFLSFPSPRQSDLDDLWRAPGLAVSSVSHDILDITVTLPVAHIPPPSLTL